MINPSTSSLLQCNQSDNIWLLNCPEGSQHKLIKQKIRIHQINNIILTNLNIENLAGLMGFLSSLSLNSRIHQINLYGPPGLSNYLKLARKYSQTTFKYNIAIYNLSYGYIISSFPYIIYSYPFDLKNQQFEYIILEKEQIGRFSSFKAKLFNFMSGPLYGDLKRQNRFLTPDGNILAGKFFTGKRAIGLKILYLRQVYGYRSSIESVLYSTEVIKYKTIGSESL